MTDSENVWVVIPNWNGSDLIRDCLSSLEKQSQPANILVVDNGSTDDSTQLIENEFPKVELLKLPTNRGFSGGVNAGIHHAMKKGAEMVALINNDAEAEQNWVKNLVQALGQDSDVGMVTGKLLKRGSQTIDDTGLGYSIWGMSFPRGRGQIDQGQFDDQPQVFGATGGATLYRAKMLEEIGLFDEQFFAYYEDVDISFRAQLAGWKVLYVSSAVAYHQIGATSSKIKGFTTYQALKNLPMIVRKNVPLSLLPTVLPRFWLAYTAFFWSAVARGQIWPALKGWFMAAILLPKNFGQRFPIQKTRTVSDDYIRSILTWDLPPDATKLRKLRSAWRKLIGKKS